MRNLQQVVRVASLLDATRLGAIAQSGCAIDRECWRRILGERIAERSAPNTIPWGTLTVKVASSVWAQELSLLTPEIFQRLQNTFPCFPPSLSGLGGFGGSDTKEPQRFDRRRKQDKISIFRDKFGKNHRKRGGTAWCSLEATLQLIP
jgi:predicted nucleic acid-binding Zn ribbon protein